MRVAVGSLSRYKLAAVEDAFKLITRNGQASIEVLGANVSSGVSSQPMSSEESILGARNRAQGAISFGHPNYGIGIENGLIEIDFMWFATTWIVAIDSCGTEGAASTLLRPVPPLILERIREGFELSEAIERELNLPGEVDGPGFIGILTDGILERHGILREGVITAMSRHLKPDLFRASEQGRSC